MPFSIQTKDGITINNIPDDVAQDSDVLKQRVATIRAERGGEPAPEIAPVETPVEQPAAAEPQEAGFDPRQLFSQLAGAPVDALTAVANIVGAGITDPVGGSASIQRGIESLQGPTELAATLATGAVLEPVAGVAGIAQALNPFAEEGAGARAVEAVQGLGFQPGEAGRETGAALIENIAEVTPDIIKQAGGDAIRVFQEAGQATNERFGPLAATALTIAPAAILEAIPGGLAIKKARNMQVSIADEIAEQAVDKLKDEGVDAIKAGAPPEVKEYAEIAEDLRKKRTAEVAEQVLPDQEILDAAEALNVDLNPSHYSTNRAFIDVENSLKSRPGSKLATIEERAILDSGRAADNLIEELRGSTDKSLLDVDIKDEINARISSLEDQAGVAYRAVDEAIPNSTQVNPTASREYINRQLADLGGDKTLLTTAEKNLLRIAEADSHLTYSAIDRIRRDIGSALGKKSGPFKDDDAGTLKQLYKVLSEDQQGVADAFGVGADYAAARKLVATRKGLEDEAVALFGREVGGSIIPKLTQAATALTKGDVSKFNSLMDALPAGRRQEVAATMLNNLFTQGARTQGSISQGFVKAFEGLNRNKEAKKALFAQLPAGAEKRFDDIGKVATGIFRSKALENNSRTARDIIAALEEGGLISRIYDKTAAVVAPIVGGPVVSAVTTVINKARTPAVEAADALLTSPAFKKSIEDAGQGSLNKSQEITKTAVFKKWLTNQPPDIQAEVAAIGFIPFLTNPSEL